MPPSDPLQHRRKAHAMPHRIGMIFGVVFLATGSVSFGATWHVKASVSSSGDGTSWGQAFKTLQEALTESTLTTGDEIWVANGTYLPVDCAPSCTPADREATFKLVAGVGVYGGFAGTETTRLKCENGTNNGVACPATACEGGGTCTDDQRVIESNETTLSGDLNNDDVLPSTDLACTTAGGRWGPVYCDGVTSGDPSEVASASQRPITETACGGISGTWVEGICDTIDSATNKRPITEVTCEDVNVGGTWYDPTCDKLDPALIDDNSYQVVKADATSNGAVLDGFVVIGGHADAGDCWDSVGGFQSEPCHSDSECTDINANWLCRHICLGGTNAGEACVPGAGNCPPYFNCGFSPLRVGAALFNFGGDITVKNTVFKHNLAAFRGGGMLTVSSATAEANLTLDNVDFVANRTGEHGGGFYSGGSANGLAKADLTDCTFVWNWSSACAGGACNRRTEGTWTRCRFLANTAQGGVFGGGGGLFNSSSSPHLLEAVFLFNEAPSASGGGVWNETNTESGAGDPSNPTFQQSRFLENLAQGGNSQGGGAVWNQDGSEAVFVDCQFCKNVGTDYGGAVFNTDSLMGNPTRSVVRDCVFVENRATGLSSGGAILNSGGGAFSAIDTLFIDNHSSMGGAVNNHTGEPTDLIACTLAGNASSVGGGLLADHAQSTRTINSLLVGNEASGLVGGGGACARSSANLLTMVNSTVADNTATNAGATGGGIRTLSSGSQILVKNSIVSGNTAAAGTSSGATAQISDVPHTDVTNTLWSGSDDDTILGNIGATAVFTQLASGQWTATAQYFPDVYQTRFTHTGAGWTTDQFVGELINLDTSQMRQTVIVSNTTDTITV